MLSINNESATSRTVAVSVLYSEETVLSKEYKISPKKGNVVGGRVIDVPSVNEPGKVEIRAAMNDQIKVLHLEEQYEAACLQVQVWIESTGVLTFRTGKKGTACFEN
jgi:hypothetical protein